jgi:hypothetical protein
MALSRLQQIAIRQETTEGAAVQFSSLFAASLAKYLVIDPSLDFTVNVFNRNIKRGSFTALPSLTGTRTGTCRFSLELAGDTTATAAPTFGLPLRACGFRQEALMRLDIGAITNGPFYHGQMIEQTTTGAKGMVVGTTYTGESYLWVAQENYLGFAFGATTVTPFSTGGSLFVQGSPAGSATCSAPTAVAGTYSGLTMDAPAGYAYFPWSYPLSILNVGQISVTIPVNTVLKGATTGALGIWYSPTGSASGTTGGGTTSTLFIRPIKGTFNTSENITSIDGVTTYTVASTATPLGATVVQNSQFQIPTVSIGMAKDGVRESIKSSRGTVSFSGRIGEPMIMAFEFQGGLNETSNKSAQDAGNIAGITYTQKVPPVLLNADLTHGKTATTSSTDEYGPCISQIDIAMNNQLALRECMADAAGVQETLLAGRAPTISIDPEQIQESVWDFLEQFTDNTVTRAKLVVGSDAQNQFYFKTPGVSWTSVTTGDRNGIATRQLQANLNGGEAATYNSGEDNELVLIYRTV